MKKHYLEAYEQLVNVADDAHRLIGTCDRFIDRILEIIYLGDIEEQSDELHKIIHAAAASQSNLIKHYQQFRLMKVTLARVIDYNNNVMED